MLEDDDLLFGEHVEGLEEKFEPTEFIDNMGEDMGDLLEHFLEEDDSCVAGDPDGHTNGQRRSAPVKKPARSLLERGHRLPSRGHFRDISPELTEEASNIEQQPQDDQAEKQSTGGPLASSKPLTIRIKKRNSDTSSLVELDECLTPTKKTRVNGGLNNLFNASPSPHPSPLTTEPLMYNNDGMGAAVAAVGGVSPSCHNHHMNGHHHPNPRHQHHQHHDNPEAGTFSKSFLSMVKEGASKSKISSGGGVSLLSTGGAALDGSVGSPGNSPGNYGLSPTSLKENGFEKPAHMLKPHAQNGATNASETLTSDYSDSLVDPNVPPSPPQVKNVVSVNKLTERLAASSTHSNGLMPKGIAQHVLETSHQVPAGNNSIVSVVKAGGGGRNQQQQQFSKAVVLSSPVETKLDTKMLTKYSNGSEEAKYHLKNMRKNLREEYFKLIDSGHFTVYDLDNRCLQKLTNSNNEISMKVVRYLREADLSHIRNKSAYLERMINRENNRSDALKVKSKMDGTAANQLNVKLAPNVEKKLEALIQSGQIQKDEFMDPLLMENLGSLPEPAAMGLLLQLETIDMNRIRNFKAFFLSLSKKYMREHVAVGGHSHMALSGTNPSSSHSGGRQYGYNDLHGNNRRRSPTQSFTNRRSPGAEAYNHSCVVERSMKNHSLVQRALGVRTDEMHTLSAFACMVPASIALQLQNLHDQGVELVTLLDDTIWRIMATLEESVSMTLVMDIGRRLKQDMTSSSKIPRIRNVNAFFLDLHKKLMQRLQSPMHQSPEHGGVNLSPSHLSHMQFQKSPKQFQPREPHDPKRFDQLNKTTRNEIDMLIAASNGILRHEMFDPRSIATLKEMSSNDVRLVCSQFRKIDVARVHNHFAFFIGMCRNHLNGSRKK